MSSSKDSDGPNDPPPYSPPLLHDFDFLCGLVYEMIQLIHGDCLEILENIPAGSVDLVLTDLPYGTTNCPWDIVVPLRPMWELLDKVKKPKAAVVLFGAEPFSSSLRLSNLKEYKYDWFWRKDSCTGHLNAKKQPLREVELISVFYKNQCDYFPQYVAKEHIRPATIKRKPTGVYGSMTKESVRELPDDVGYPKNVLKFNGEHGFHPTQKPTDLLEFLIKTYTQEGAVILDFTMGSGSTGVAAKKLKRSFIGIEKDEAYFNIAKKRIENGESVYQADLF